MERSSTPETSTASDAPSSGSRSSSGASQWPGAAVQLAAIAAITVAWCLGRFPPETPWWGPPGAIGIASDPLAVLRLVARIRGK